MLKSKEWEFVRRLHDQTKQGKLAWASTLVDGEFEVKFPGYSVTIEQENYNADSSRSEFGLKIYDEQNTLVDAIWSSPPLRRQAASEEDVDAATLFEVLEDIYHVAQWESVGTEQALDKLIAVMS